MQYNNYNNPYNPYNPYLCNNIQHNPNIATAPPLDEANYRPQTPEIHQMPQNYMHTHIQQPCPVYPYPYPDGCYTTPTASVEQYNRVTQMRKKQEDDCLCVGLLSILCCCFL